MPALPLDDAGPYVAGAFLVFLALVLVYVSIMASKLARIERELGELHEQLDRREHGAEEPGAAGDGTGASFRPTAAKEAPG